jgi:hypothetical protein
LAGRGRKKRNALFDLYSRHIALYEPDKRGIFVCPLCLDGFTGDALDGPDPALTLAHVIPKSLGGKLCTLTCKACNNENGGHRIEAPLVERFLAEDCMAGVIRQTGRLSGAFGDITVQFTRSPEQNGWSFFPVPEQSNQESLESYKKRLVEANGDPSMVFPIELSLPYRHQPRRVEAALYQSAFLLMFAHFGYEFVLHPHFAQLREQIRRPEEGTWRTRIVIPSENSVTALLGTRDHAVMFLRQPSAILTFLRLHPRGGRPRVLAVVLPGLDGPALPPGNWMSFEGGIVPYIPEALLRVKFFLFKLWRHTRRTQAGPQGALA